MMSGIRIRLLVAVGMVVAVSIATVGYISSRIARSEFHRFLLEESAGEDPVSHPVLDRLAAYHHRAGGWSGVGALLSELAGETTAPSRLLLLDDAGSIAGASTPDLAGAITTLEGDLLMLKMKGDDGDVQLAFRGGWTDVIDSAGSRIGRLYALPPDHEPRGGPESHFMLSVNSWLIGLVAAAGLLALGITALVARRILGPVEELTTAARAMERGDLGRRVTVRSDDEIGKLGKAFNAMAEGLERTETLRGRMVSDVAHELRTPLTSIRCQIEALRDGLVTPDPETIGSIEEYIFSLQHVVDDLQDLALAEAGQIRLERQPVTLAAEAARVIRSFTSDGGPGITIDLEGLPPA